MLRRYVTLHFDRKYVKLGSIAAGRQAGNATVSHNRALDMPLLIPPAHGHRVLLAAKFSSA
jgi:hypothetical protein